METSRKKKSNLSLSKTPTKSSKFTPEDQNVSGIVNLISDDEDDQYTSSFEGGSPSVLSSLDTTVQYKFENFSAPTSSPKAMRSPQSNRKYYSPTKKRLLTIRSPVKAKRNLMMINDDDEFKNIIQGLDDMTIFLMNVIYKYLCDTNMHHLLSEASLNLLEKFMHVAKPGMRLVCRLYWQQEKWCKWDKIKKTACGKKTDIGDPVIQEALNSLIESGLITVSDGQGHGLDFDDIMDIMKVEELKDICKDLKIKVSKKDEAVQALRNFMSRRTNITNYFICSNSSNENRLLMKLREKLGMCYKLSEQARVALKELYILMYLGMDYTVIRERKLELMLLNEKRLLEIYPIDLDFPVDNACVVFKSRQEFEQYLTAFFVYEDFLMKTQLADKCALIENVFRMYGEISEEQMTRYGSLPVWLRRFTPAYVYVKVLDQGIAELKRDESKVELALEILSVLVDQELFRQHKKAEWFNEKALIVDKFFGDAEQAAKVLLRGFQSKLPSHAEASLCPRALKLANRKVNNISSELQATLLAEARRECVLEKNIQGTHIYKVPMNNYGGRKIKFETFEAGERTVRDAEDYCRYHYVDVTSKYTGGGHWEGKIAVTIFFLLFWDIIYARLRGIRGIYLSRYQMYPLDLLTDTFYSNRKSLIDQRLLEIERSTETEVLERMEANWKARPECEKSGIHREIGWENVSAVVTCLGPRGVTVLCRRLAIHYHYAHSGFPDLTLWNIDTKKVSFVEVKTDSDKPCMKQIQWMHYLKENGVDVKFCYVGVHTTRAKSRNYTEDSGDE